MIKEILKWLCFVLIFPLGLAISYGIVFVIEWLYSFNQYLTILGIISIMFGTYLYIDFKFR